MNRSTLLSLSALALVTPLTIVAAARANAKEELPKSPFETTAESVIKDTLVVLCACEGYLWKCDYTNAKITINGKKNVKSADLKMFLSDPKNRASSTLKISYTPGIEATEGETKIDAKRGTKLKIARTTLTVETIEVTPKK